MTTRQRQPRRAAGTAAMHRSAPQAVRIIAGKWRRSLLPVLDAGAVRPTPDRVRETLFNWIAHFSAEGLAPLRVLDLFAGSGALGLEAASRGAQAVTLIDSSAEVIDALKATLVRLKDDTVVCRRDDALSFLKQAALLGQHFDLVFLDPPFRAGWIERLLAPASALLVPGGLLYIESEAALADAVLSGYALAVLRKDKAGQVVYHLLRRNIDAAGEGPRTNGEAAC